MPQADRKRLLQSLELFEGLPDDALEQLVALTATRKLEAREELCHEGDAAGPLYGILRGHVKAMSTSEDGKETVFNLMGPGEVMGEIALLDAEPRSATMVAVAGCELLVLPRRDFLAFMRGHPDVALHLAQVLAARVRRLSEAVQDAHFRHLPARLAKTLLALGRSAGVETPAGLRIEIKLSQQDLGDFVGKTREAVNKQMRAWIDEGLVSADAGVVVLRDVEALERLAGYAE